MSWTAGQIDSGLVTAGMFACFSSIAGNLEIDVIINLWGGSFIYASVEFLNESNNLVVRVCLMPSRRHTGNHVYLRSRQCSM